MKNIMLSEKTGETFIVWRGCRPRMWEVFKNTSLVPNERFSEPLTPLQHF